MNRIILTAVALILSFSASAAELIRTPEGVFWDYSYDRYITSQQSGSRGIYASQMLNQFTLGQPTYLDNWFHLVQDSQYTVRQCTGEEEFARAASVGFKVAFMAALQGWAQYNNREATGAFGRVGFANGVNASLGTQCIVVLRRPVRQDPVERVAGNSGNTTVNVNVNVNGAGTSSPGQVIVTQTNKCPDGLKAYNKTQDGLTRKVCVSFTNNNAVLREIDYPE